MKSRVPVTVLAVLLFAWVKTFDPFFSPPLWSVPLWAFLLTEIAAFPTSIYLHRGLNHGSIKFHWIAALVSRTILWLTTTQKRKQWVAVHRKHHTFTDREGDPHSPKLFGFWHVQFGNAWLYAREATPDNVRKFAPDIKDDWLERWFFGRTLFGPFVAGLGGLYVFLGWKGILAGLLHGVLYVFVLAPLINALGHWRGKQNFTDNTAYNWKWLSWLTAGEALHNNHHGNPVAPNFAVAPGEFDPSWPVIRIMIAAHAATIVGNLDWVMPKVR